MYWNIDRKLKNRKLAALILSTDKVAFIITMTVCILLDAIGVFLLVLIGIMGCMTKTWDGIIIVSVLGGPLFCFILVTISEYIRRKVTLNLGQPHSERVREFIHLEKAGVEFGYHYLVYNTWPDSMNLYQICYEDINDISYDPELMMLTLTGVANLTAYDDFYSNRINYSLSQRQFYSDTKFFILLATPEAEKIVDEIKKRVAEFHKDDMYF